MSKTPQRQTRQQTRSHARKAQMRSVARYGEFDSAPRAVIPLAAYTPKRLADTASIDRATARALIAAARRSHQASIESLRQLVDPAGRRRVHQSALLPDDTRMVITDVAPTAGWIMSDQPFTLRVSFAAARSSQGLVRVDVAWAGEPFAVEAQVGDAECDQGYIDVNFGARQTLPIGPASFTVTLTSDSGARDSFMITCAVLPSNPFSLQLSPRDHFVTGTFSLRAIRDQGNYVTVTSVTLSNGDSTPVQVKSGYHWEAWDGGIGSGTLVEQGDGAFAGGTITVGAHDTWGGWISLTSPPGSGIFKKFDAKEDLAVKVTMTRVPNNPISGNITARTMFRYGLNIIRVGAESFTNTEYQDLYQAVDITRTIYERRDVTLSINRMNITNAQAGGFTVITSETEARDLFAAWNGADNQFIDVFVVHSITGTDFDGLAGAIPGPLSHAGRSSAVVVDKKGFVDGAGNHHLNVSYLGMLIGHEVGHYLGLVHVNDVGNLMLSDSSPSDTALNYDPQYRTLIRFGWMNID
jgi:hypothetical protein